MKTKGFRQKPTRFLGLKLSSFPQACLSCHSYTKHSLFPRNLFFDVKFMSKNISINTFIHPCNGTEKHNALVYNNGCNV